MFCFPSPSSIKQNVSHRNSFFNESNLNFAKNKIEINLNIVQILILSFSLITFLWQTLLHLCSQVRYVAFNINLNIYKKKYFSNSPPFCWWYISITIVTLLLSEYENEQILLFVICGNPNLNFVLGLALKFKKTLSLTLLGTSSIFMFTIAVTPTSHDVCLFVFQIICHLFAKRVPSWLPILLILLSNDIHLNPGPDYTNNFFNFMTWNLNSITTNDFERVGLIEADNSSFYDLISICETNLTDYLVPKVPKLDGYDFEPANHPANVAHGGVGIFFKNFLPVTPRRDLSFDESLVLEIKFGRRKIFFTVLYRSPAYKHSTPEFETFLLNFKNLHSRIKAENPFAMYFTGDFNAHSKLWWPDGDSNPEGRELEDLFTSLNLTQIISEPTNFEPGKKPSCIDLIVTDQPNLILDSGIRASLDPHCHHQIIYGKVNFRIPPPPPYERKIWHYRRANSAAIQRSMINFPWLQHFNLNPDINWQVKTFIEIVLNIMSNFIPNEVQRFVPRNPPWISKHLKSTLNKKIDFSKIIKNMVIKPRTKLG